MNNEDNITIFLTTKSTRRTRGCICLYCGETARFGKLSYEEIERTRRQITIGSPTMVWTAKYIYRVPSILADNIMELAISEIDLTRSINTVTDEP